MWVSESCLVTSTSQFTSLPYIGMLLTACEFLNSALWPAPHSSPLCPPLACSSQDVGFFPFCLVINASQLSPLLFICCFDWVQVEYLDNCFNTLWLLSSSEVWHQYIYVWLFYCLILAYRLVWPLVFARLSGLVPVGCIISHLQQYLTPSSFCSVIMAIMDYCLFYSISPSHGNFQQALNFCQSASSYQDLLGDMQQVYTSVPEVDGFTAKVFDILNKNRMYYKP